MYCCIHYVLEDINNLTNNNSKKYGTINKQANNADDEYLRRYKTIYIHIHKIPALKNAVRGV